MPRLLKNLTRILIALQLFVGPSSAAERFLTETGEVCYDKGEQKALEASEKAFEKTELDLASAEKGWFECNSRRCHTDWFSEPEVTIPVTAILTILTISFIRGK